MAAAPYLAAMPSSSKKLAQRSVPGEIRICAYCLSLFRLHSRRLRAAGRRAGIAAMPPGSLDAICPGIHCLSRRCRPAMTAANGRASSSQCRDPPRRAVRRHTRRPAIRAISARPHLARLGTRTRRLQGKRSPVPSVLSVKASSCGVSAGEACGAWRRRTRRPVVIL